MRDERRDERRDAQWRYEMRDERRDERRDAQWRYAHERRDDARWRNAQGNPAKGGWGKLQMAGLPGALQGPILNGDRQTGPGAPTKGGGNERAKGHHPPGSQKGKNPPGGQKGKGTLPGGQKGKAPPHKGAASGGRGRPTKGGRGYPHAQQLSCTAGLDAYCLPGLPVWSRTGSAQSSPEGKAPASPTCLPVCECDFGRATPRPGHEALSPQRQGPPSGRPQGSSRAKGKGAEWKVVGVGSRRWWPATSKGVDVANPPCGYGPGGQPQLNL
jgi:hypothetical protein